MNEEEVRMNKGYLEEISGLKKSQNFRVSIEDKAL
jgi:hypothetical protein